MFIALNKAATVVFWLLVVVAQVQGWQGWLGLLPQVGLAVAVIHVLEVAYFWLSLKQRSSNPVADALQIFVFGIFHMKRFIEQQDA